ncbi:hypothetical protein [Fimbriiglobus ruber]|uniref:hypothetical protein n=1 Tax=Fimbriiglobus ruber TaxID=1908690 RepID=UPI0013795B9C|nr:hypothetical protein [Fimbriiglobus ruber]
MSVRLDSTTGYGYSLLFNAAGQVQFLDDGVAWGNSYSFAWSVGTWYTFRLQVVGNTLLGKVWATGSAEPAGDVPPGRVDEPDRRGAGVGRRGERRQRGRVGRVVRQRVCV